MDSSTRATSAPPGTVSRTRRAILDAAVTCYAEDLTTPLSEVARVADVGRSTLHRYFPDRAALVDALLTDAVDHTERALADAALHEGAVVEATGRLVAAVFELSPRIMPLFSDTTGDVRWDDSRWEQIHGPIGALHARGRAEGVIADEITVEWFVRVLWYLVSAGWEAIQEEGLAKHRAVALVTRSLLRGVTADPA
ncbi:TetR/AcrR family transcriptional regulator [Streptomyces spiramenti]|uniref:TetR/AcrR family transcriptional regulator n=1 Tax=Streptomyces spiramenti TaxID=2720606 RepID=A0ABX1AJB3_9ACTN|nr:TetR/AcrR family transcriptional regulator [Streptomyces spiramenti]NJP67214.1 TetR/AcrR family transcriptional regulator [Streptomyces spiramenti]